ncbi:hypothetical protein C8Q80DRAFT_1124768 [Daedaleopsis nitida]|nr:hypothetical protein C8Q80DRAFT_1124768 [Daedaleopsis nitida]
MSDAADSIATLQSYRIENHCSNAAYAFLLYEHIITLGQEVELFWRRNLNGATVLFCANRFLVFSFYTMNMVSYLHMSDESCVMFAKGINVINILLYLPWALFSALRAFALSQSRLLAVIVFLLSSVTIGLNYSLYHFGLTGYNDPLVGCEGVVLDITPTLAKNYTIVSRACQIAADVLLIIITWRATHKSAAIKNIVRRSSLSFQEVLLRDGLVYFLVLFLLNSVHLICTMLALQPALQASSYVSVLMTPYVSSPLTAPAARLQHSVIAVLVSRFLIDLQTADRNTVNMFRTSHGSALAVDETIVFGRAPGRIVGSIGSSIYPGNDSGTGTTSTSGTGYSTGEGAFELELVDGGESSFGSTSVGRSVAVRPRVKGV